jgi:hypothetical protein
MYGSERPNIFRTLIPRTQWIEEEEEGIEKKLEKAYEKMQKRGMASEKRRKRGNAEWQPKLHEKVLVKTQRMSDAIKGITAKFMHVFEGPFLISKILNHSAYELKNERGKIRGEFNKKQLKQYIEEENVQKEGSDL